LRMRFTVLARSERCCGATMGVVVPRKAGEGPIEQTCPPRLGCKEGRMTTISSTGGISSAGAGFLDKERTIAAAGFNRWLVPPAALCIHLCIGMSYRLRVFWLALSRAVA